MNDEEFLGLAYEESEKYYTVGEPDCAKGCCTPVFVADMTPEEGPLFFVETDKKAELAAELIGVSLEELERALKLYKEYEGFKKNGLKSIGFTDGYGEAPYGKNARLDDQ